MPFLELKKGYPFPGAAAKFTMPPGPNDWQPKSWGIAGYATVGTTRLFDDSAHFLDDGLEIFDVLYIMAGTPPLIWARAITGPISQTELDITDLFPGTYTNLVYKVGMKAPHTLQTLQTIVATRGLYGNTAHWSTVWTQAPFADFRHDELGDVYVCHNPGGRRLRELKKQWNTANPGSEEPNPWDNLNPEPDL